MKTFEWSAKALADLKRLHDFLKSKNPNAALRAVDAIREGAVLLASHPQLGRPMGDGRRELLIPFAGGNYALRYRLDGEIVVIIRVWHHREEK